MNIKDLKNLDCDTLLYLARVSEQSERYDEMASYINGFARKTNKELSVEERNILSVAYKNVLGCRRAAWRILCSLENSENSIRSEEQKMLAKAYRLEVENEIEKSCREIIDLLDSKLIISASSSEAQVFYLKLKGDYYRYMCEFLTNEGRNENCIKALNAYQEAENIAINELQGTNPIRLGVSLNFSVFLIEVMKDSDSAKQMSQKAFDEAMTEIDLLGNETFKESTLILQLLRDNLVLWSSS
ncbi:unnamed protein product [Blepharisma stoltei]|uniref:14-3-3 domain-containing protein n=1 Tax=Blepharisma stoltei TaxID=1481888 RepID=A0AAU9K751_9CILI|nr:unnamed protein product [Blepharisma stoltei]